MFRERARPLIAAATLAALALLLSACDNNGKSGGAVNALTGGNTAAATATPRPTVQPGPTSPADVAGGVPSLHGGDEACVFETSYVPRDGWRKHQPEDGGQVIWVEPICEWVYIATPAPEED